MTEQQISSIKAVKGPKEFNTKFILEFDKEWIKITERLKTMSIKEEIIVLAI